MYTNAELFLLALEQPKELFGGNVTLSIPDDEKGRIDLDSEKERLFRIWDVAHMSMADVVKSSGMTQTAFAKYAGVPLRTVQDWCAGCRSCPVYVRFLLAEHYGLIVRKE